MESKIGEFNGMKALIMGLGLNGGGLESALYLHKMGAEITITDLRTEDVLKPSIDKLKGIPIQYVLGRHNIEDFKKADLVVKNPGVRGDSPYLKNVRRVETDISLFLTESPAKLIAVTGTKGKSSVSSAIHHALSCASAHKLFSGSSWLGGNIAVSPLSFLDKLKKDDYVVLELSSFQLGDLRSNPLLKPRAVVMTPILQDHLDRYGTMENYINDKRVIYQNQDNEDAIIVSDDSWGMSFKMESRARAYIYGDREPEKGISGGWYGAWDAPAFTRLWNAPQADTCFALGSLELGETIELVPAKLKVKGMHQKQNLLSSALALLDLGLSADFIRECMGSFGGVEHRLELFHEKDEINFFDDTCATIPESALAAVKSFAKPPLLLCGGSDKKLDFGILAEAVSLCRKTFLLEGEGTEKLREFLHAKGMAYYGPYSSLEAALDEISRHAVKGDNILLSPGCSSFGMFANEFDRGNKWKKLVRERF